MQVAREAGEEVGLWFFGPLCGVIFWVPDDHNFHDPSSPI